jgi:hypothetical protein
MKGSNFLLFILRIRRSKVQEYSFNIFFFLQNVDNTNRWDIVGKHRYKHLKFLLSDLTQHSKLGSGLFSCLRYVFMCMCYLCCLCLFTHSHVQHILRVLVFSCLFDRLVFRVSLDCPFKIAPSVFNKVFLYLQYSAFPVLKPSMLWSVRSDSDKKIQSLCYFPTP